jgi:hypothetical protein
MSLSRGAQPYSMRVWLNPDLMYSRGLTAVAARIVDKKTGKTTSLDRIKVAWYVNTDKPSFIN